MEVYYTYLSLNDLLIVSGNPAVPEKQLNEEKLSSSFNGKINVFHPTQDAKIFQGFVLTKTIK